MKFRYSNTNGSEVLRETHGDKVMALIGTPGSDNVSGRALREACLAVRDTYRCRDVRKELRRVAMLCDDGEVKVERI